jgi:hypothetical protein
LLQFLHSSCRKIRFEQPGVAKHQDNVFSDENTQAETNRFFTGALAFLGMATEAHWGF